MAWTIEQLYPLPQETKKFVYKKWEDILVGDILELNLNDVIPADIVLLESSDENEMCFIETANLDGETNLKQKRRLDIQFDNLEEFNYYISTQKPNSDLNTFQGYVAPFDRASNGQRKGLNNENIIYRGCILRNTDRITGFVVYAGSKTKACFQLYDFEIHIICSIFENYRRLL